MKFCKDCNNMFKPSLFSDNELHWICQKAPTQVSPVSGNVMYDHCINSRTTFGTCGTEGTFWEKKQGD